MKITAIHEEQRVRVAFAAFYNVKPESVTVPPGITIQVECELRDANRVERAMKKIEATS